jgi:hypothetical protein
VNIVHAPVLAATSTSPNAAQALTQQELWEQFVGLPVHVKSSYSKVSGCCRRMKYGKTHKMHGKNFQTQKGPPHMSMLTALQTKLSEQAEGDNKFLGSGGS